MDKFSSQIEILSEISQIIFDSSPDGCTEIGCEFIYDRGYDDESFSVGGDFWFIKDGERVSDFLQDPEMKISELIPLLHSLMKEHTGGDWKSFILTLDENGQARTKFNYGNYGDSLLNP